jgi:hypothetical protein
VGDLHRFELFEASLLGNLVLAFVGILFEVTDIGDVADIAHLVAEVLEEFHEYIISHTRTSMSEVRVAINCRAADIKSHVALVDRLEDLFLSRKGIGYI